LSARSRLLRVTSLASANVRARQRSTPFAGHIACIGKRSCPAKVAPPKASHPLRVTPFARASACARQKSRPLPGHAVCTSKRLRPAKVAPSLRLGSEAGINQTVGCACPNAAASWDLQGMEPAKQGPRPARVAPRSRSHGLLVMAFAKAKPMPGKPCAHPQVTPLAGHGPCQSRSHARQVPCLRWVVGTIGQKATDSGPGSSLRRVSV